MVLQEIAHIAMQRNSMRTVLKLLKAEIGRLPLQLQHLGLSSPPEELLDKGIQDHVHELKQSDKAATEVESQGAADIGCKKYSTLASHYS
jgi:hypothetical protein